MRGPGSALLDTQQGAVELRTFDPQGGADMLELPHAASPGEVCGDSQMSAAPERIVDEAYETARTDLYEAAKSVRIHVLDQLAKTYRLYQMLERERLLCRHAGRKRAARRGRPQGDAGLMQRPRGKRFPVRLHVRSEER